MREQRRSQESQPEKRREDRPESRQIGDEPVSAPAGTKTNHSRHHHRRSQWIPVIAMLLFMILDLAATVSCYGSPTPIQTQLDIRPKRHARKGSLTSGEPGESKPVEAGGFWVILNQLFTIETGSQGCSIGHENLEGNHYGSRISLYLRKIGRLISGTTCVGPGYYVESIWPKESLPPGKYPVTVRIELFEDKTPAGGMSIDITLRMTENQGGETG